jgi:hypothetical protein
VSFDRLLSFPKKNLQHSTHSCQLRGDSEVRELSTAQPSAGARRGPNPDARKKNAHGNSAGPRRHRRRPAASKPPRPPSVKSPFRKLIISAVQAVDPFFSDKENGPSAGGGRPQRQRFIMDIVLDYCLWDHANTVLTADSDVYGASDNRPSAIPVRRFYDFIDPEDLDEYWYDQRTIWGGLRPVSPIFTSTHVSAERSTAAWTPRLDSDVAPDNEFLRWSGDTPSSASGSSPAAQASWP